jgi:HEPN domain-containing protein
MRMSIPEHYFRASLERIEQARLLYGQGSSYALSMYVAGLAVECLLRAFKLKRDPTFDERHDLLRLFHSCGMLDVDEAILHEQGLSLHEARRFVRERHAAVVAVCTLWANDYRFASEDRLRSHLKRIRLDRGVRGDYLKENTRKLLTAAGKLIDMGVAQW